MCLEPRCSSHAAACSCDSPRICSSPGSGTRPAVPSRVGGGSILGVGMAPSSRALSFPLQPPSSALPS
eukprot:3264413-Pyramimonas_sp.AAC.2